MKILCVGDQHFRFDLPYSSAFDDGRKGEWESVKNTIQETAKDCDAVILMGDNLNTKHNHSSVISEFIDFLKAFGDKEIHILVGNHERYGTYSALDFLKKVAHPKWHVYDTVKCANVAGEAVMMIPYMTPALLGVETNEEGVKEIISKFPSGMRIPLAVVHHAITGATVHGMSMDLFNEIVLPKEEMEKHFGKTFAGHVHEKQVLSDDVYMLGNIFTNETGEHNKSIWVYEKEQVFTDDEDEPKSRISVHEIPLPVRGIYKLTMDRSVKDGKEFKKIPKNSIVKCFVTDRQLDVERVKNALESTFDASIIVEQYPNERAKVHFEEGGLDLSVDSLLKLYADAKEISHEDLKEGFELINK